MSIEMTKRPELVLEAVVGGELPDAVLRELVQMKTRAKDAATDFSHACEDMSKKYVLKKAALVRYITAVEADTLMKLQKETDSLASLLEKGGAG